MKLQAVMNRSTEKQGTDLLDIVRLVFDQRTRPVALAQISQIDTSMASDVALHSELWFRRRRKEALRWIHAVGGIDVEADDVEADDLDLVAELLLTACRRT